MHFLLDLHQHCTSMLLQPSAAVRYVLHAYSTSNTLASLAKL